MLLFQAVVLGIVQGLTEFLPVSSSGHLILVRDVFQWKLLGDDHLNKMFDVALHAATFCALAVYFRPDLARLAKAFGASLRGGIAGDFDRQLAWLLVVGTVPAAVAGLLLRTAIETKLAEPLLVSTLLVIFALVLWAAEWRGLKRRELREAGWWDGIVLGVAQATSLVPGVSRSGITITAGLARGMTREAAARFSFLLSIPIIGGTALYGLLSLLREPGAFSADSIGMFAVGMVAAGVSGYLCIHYFLRYLQTRSLVPFVTYRIGLGVFLLLWLGSRAT
jgi:undecaprenyl-diphosphatase